MLEFEFATSAVVAGESEGQSTRNLEAKAHNNHSIRTVDVHYLQKRLEKQFSRYIDKVGFQGYLVDTCLIIFVGHSESTLSINQSSCYAKDDERIL